MIVIPGYTILKNIHEGREFLLLQAIRDIDKLPVIIKSTSIKNIKSVKKLENEYELVASIENEITLKPISLQKTHQLIALVLEDFKGITLFEYLKGKAIELKPFLMLAEKIASALSKVHEAGIIHKDINPQNILVSFDGNEVRIIDFDISSKLPFEYLKTIPNSKVLEGTLSYMSPEQTGRINRGADYRTDMYSLGITFYEMITGVLPFTDTDPFDLVYSHIAKTPIPPNAINSLIPKQVSDIILKLISKLAENRYESMIGLKSDLVKCIRQLEKTSTIEAFVLGENDITGRLNVSQKIYGREKEIKTLLDIYENIKETGIPELVLVTGYAGIGKTTLVNELSKPITETKGFFITGKFDQLKRDVPYYSFIESFQGLIMEVLSESEVKLSNYRQNLIDALGINGQLIVDIIPQLELIIGKQEPVTKLPPDESQIRFNMFFEKFIKVFSKEKILTIFLDDLQWVDMASLNLIQQIITNPDSKNIFLIGAYRDNEIELAHPLIIALNEIKKTAALYKEIKVTPLKPQLIADFINDSLKNKTEDVKPLADLIFEKTGGNTFFVIQFLISLYQSKLLKFDYKYLEWKWELNEIKAEEYTKNVVDLIERKIKMLNADTQNLLHLAACIGNKFELKTLSIASSETVDVIEKKLQPAFMDILIVQQDDQIKFFNDSIQQAAYALFPDENLSEIHLKIARQLLKNHTEEKNKEHVFEIVNQFNLVDLKQLNKNEKKEIAELNYEAVKKAKMLIAYDASLKYASAGIKLLSESDWIDNYELMFNLHLEKANGEYLKGNFEITNKLIEFLLSKANTKIDKAAAYQIKIRLHHLKSEISASIDAALECLKLFDVNIPLHPIKENVTDEYEKLNKNIGNRDIEDLINLPLMTDPEIKVTMEILSELYAPAFFIDKNLFVLHLIQMINLSLLYGNTNASVLAYGAFGVALTGEFNEYNKGYSFAKLGIELVEKRNFISFKAKANFMMALLDPWHKPLSMGIKFCKRAFLAAIETADIHIATYSIAYIPLYMDIRGDILEDVFFETQVSLDFNRKIKSIDMEFMAISQQQFIFAMQGLTGVLSSSGSSDFNEINFEKKIEERTSTVKSRYFIYKMKTFFIAGNFKEAMEAGVKAEKIHQSISGMIFIIEFYYYYSLTLIANYELVDADTKNKFLEKLNFFISILNERALDCPQNFYNKQALVQAEFYRITNKDDDAVNYYEQAIKSAKDNGFIANHAISLELTSNFYRKIQNEIVADKYLKDACDTYLQWGATGKVNQLQNLYPFLVEENISLSNKQKNAVEEEKLSTASTLNKSIV